MEPVTLVVTALAAGLTASVSGTLTKVASDALDALKARVIDCFRRGGIAEATGQELISHSGEGGSGRTTITQRLSMVDVDEPTIEAAKRLLELLNGSGKFHVDIRDSTGVMIGDHNAQTINIHPR